MKYFNKFEKIILVLILFYSGGAWLFIAQPLTAAETGKYRGGPLSSLIHLGIYAITALLIVIRWKRFLYVLSKNKLLMLTLIIVLGSVLWSVSPESTNSMNKGLIRITFLGIYIAARYSLKDQMKLLAWTFGLAAVLGLLYCLVFPDFGIQAARFGETAGWRGLYFQKNDYGRQMSFSSILFLLLALKQRQYNWLLWTLFGISLSQLLLSNSKTALLCFITTITWMLIAPILRQSKKIFFFIMPLIISILGGLMISIITNLKFFFDLLGKDMTLTGRLPVWFWLLEKVGEKPWLGYGNAAFWPMINKDAKYLYSFQWHPGHAHNGFLELFLSIGIIGMSLFLLSFIIDYRRAIAFASLKKHAENYWPIQFLTITLVTNIAVNSTFFDTSVYWMLYVTVVCSVSLEFDRLYRHKKQIFIK